MHTMSQLRQKIAKKGAKGKSSNCDWMHLVFKGKQVIPDANAAICLRYLLHLAVITAWCKEKKHIKLYLDMDENMFPLHQTLYSVCKQAAAHCHCRSGWFCTNQYTTPASGLRKWWSTHTHQPKSRRYATPSGKSIQLGFDITTLTAPNRRRERKDTWKRHPSAPHQFPAVVFKKNSTSFYKKESET